MIQVQVIFHFSTKLHIMPTYFECFLKYELWSQTKSWHHLKKKLARHFGWKPMILFIFYLPLPWYCWRSSILFKYLKLIEWKEMKVFIHGEGFPTMPPQCQQLLSSMIPDPWDSWFKRKSLLFVRSVVGFEFNLQVSQIIWL